MDKKLVLCLMLVLCTASIIMSAPKSGKVKKSAPATDSTVVDTAKSTKTPTVHEVSGPTETQGPIDAQGNGPTPSVQYIGTPAQVPPTTNQQAPATPVTTAQEKPAVDSTTRAPQTPIQVKPSSAMSVDEMRAQANRLRLEAQELAKMAEDLNDEGDNLENKADDLNDKADDIQGEMEDTAERISIRLEKEILAGDSTVKTDSIVFSTKINIAKYKEWAAKIRNEADTLIQKSREIAFKVRQIEEETDKRENEAIDLEKQAEAMDPTPHILKNPWAFQFSAYLASVGALNDQDVHLITIQGIGLSYTEPTHTIFGIKDVALGWFSTIYGTRYFVAGAPYVEWYFSPLKNTSPGLQLGAELQVRTGADRDNTMAVAPFVAATSHHFIGKHFSIGPIVRMNYAAYNGFYALSNYSGMLPQGAWWCDGGFTLSVHF